jgi:predicted TIM-barrel fold metal-dependent hydrolase
MSIETKENANVDRLYELISADGHLETPPDPWVRHMPEQYRDRAPRLVGLADGRGDAWLVEGRPLLYNGQNITGAGPVKFAFEAYRGEDGEPTVGTGSPEQRLAEQDLDGLDAEVLYPPIYATTLIDAIDDRDVYRAIVRAYNTFLAEDFCAVAPDRLIGVAFIPASGIDDAIAELEFAHREGLRAVTFKQFPNGKGRSAPEDLRFWERAIELGMALAPHASFGGPMPDQFVKHDRTRYPAAAGYAQHGAKTPLPAFALTQLMVDGVFDQLPELQIYFAEAACSLLPGMLHYLDRDYAEFKDWFGTSLSAQPSEYVLEHTLWGMVREDPAIKMAQAGILPFELFMWGSDFPHSAGTFPRSTDYLHDAFSGVDEKVRREILVERPISFFKLDGNKPLTPTPLQQAVGS